MFAEYISWVIFLYSFSYVIFLSSIFVLLYVFILVIVLCCLFELLNKRINYLRIHQTHVSSRYFVVWFNIRSFVEFAVFLCNIQQKRLNQVHLSSYTNIKYNKDESRKFNKGHLKKKMLSFKMGVKILLSIIVLSIVIFPRINFGRRKCLDYFVSL